MNHNRSGKSWFDYLFFPLKIFSIPFILFVLFLLQDDFVSFGFFLFWFFIFIFFAFFIFFTFFISFLFFTLVTISFNLLFIFGISLELQVESNWELEIKLNCTALMRSLQSVINFDVNLRSVECTTTSINFPWSSKIVKSFGKSTFSFIPKSIISKSILRSCGQFKLKLESENTIDVVKEIKNTSNFISDLMRLTEMMCIILTESSYSSKTRQSSRNFISM